MVMGMSSEFHTLGSHLEDLSPGQRGLRPIPGRPAQPIDYRLLALEKPGCEEKRRRDPASGKRGKRVYVIVTIPIVERNRDCRSFVFGTSCGLLDGTAKGDNGAVVANPLHVYFERLRSLANEALEWVDRVVNEHHYSRTACGERRQASESRSGEPFEGRPQLFFAHGGGTGEVNRYLRGGATSSIQRWSILPIRVFARRIPRPLFFVP